MTVIEGPIFAFDIVAYSRREAVDQAAVQKLARRLLQEAATETGPDSPEQTWADAGDGGFLALRSDVDAGRAFMTAFAKGLAEENRTRASEHQVKMRFALHYGMIRIDQDAMGRAISGDGVNDAARLLAGMGGETTGRVVISGNYRRR
ncbi:MAG: hypothetical protein AAFU70_06920, partial [Planctomycetota bacterium]